MGLTLTPMDKFGLTAPPPQQASFAPVVAAPAAAPVAPATKPVMTPHGVVHFPGEMQDQDIQDHLDSVYYGDVAAKDPVSGPVNAFAGLLQSFANRPKSTLPTIGSRATYGMSAAQTHQTLGQIQMDNVQQQNMAERQQEEAVKAQQVHETNIARERTQQLELKHLQMQHDNQKAAHDLALKKFEFAQARGQAPHYVTIKGQGTFIQTIGPDGKPVTLKTDIPAEIETDHEQRMADIAEARLRLAENRGSGGGREPRPRIVEHTDPTTGDVDLINLDTREITPIKKGGKQEAEAKRKSDEAKEKHTEAVAAAHKSIEVLLKTKRPQSLDDSDAAGMIMGHFPEGTDTEEMRNAFKSAERYVKPPKIEDPKKKGMFNWNGVTDDPRPFHERVLGPEKKGTVPATSAPPAGTKMQLPDGRIVEVK